LPWPRSSANQSVDEVLGIGAIALVNGLLAALIAAGSLTYLGEITRVITPLKLLELMTPNNPLLKRLMVSAPGTYNHSIVAANLAESAAEAVGANAVLARVGCYFHDIGKIRRPHFFVENPGRHRQYPRKPVAYHQLGHPERPCHRGRGPAEAVPLSDRGQ